MALPEDVAIVTATQVASITGEAGLANLDEGDATLANALVQATNYLRAELLGSRGIDPDTVSNSSDLRIAAAWLVVSIRLRPQGDERSQKRADYADGQVKKYLGLYVFRSTEAGGDQLDAADMGPVVVNQDAYASFPGFNNGPPPSGAGPFRVGR